MDYGRATVVRGDGLLEQNSMVVVRATVPPELAKPPGALMVYPGRMCNCVSRRGVGTIWQTAIMSVRRVDCNDFIWKSTFQVLVEICMMSMLFTSDI